MDRAYSGERVETQMDSSSARNCEGAERDALADQVLSKLKAEGSTYVFGQFFIHVLSLSIDYIDIMK
jgi:hypothetical protein